MRVAPTGVEGDTGFSELAGTSARLSWQASPSWRIGSGAELVNTPLPDFYIGAHAAIERLALLTRDVARYRTYFPKLEILSPPQGRE